MGAIMLPSATPIWQAASASVANESRPPSGRRPARRLGSYTGFSSKPGRVRSKLPSRRESAPDRDRVRWKRLAAGLKAGMSLLASNGKWCTPWKPPPRTPAGCSPSRLSACSDTEPLRTRTHPAVTRLRSTTPRSLRSGMPSGAFEGKNRVLPGRRWRLFGESQSPMGQSRARARQLRVATTSVCAPLLLATSAKCAAIIVALGHTEEIVASEQAPRS
jgi:hypothetical protein